MPIVHLGDSRDIHKPNFQWHLHNQDFHGYVEGVPYDQRPVLYGPHVYATWESHHGLCLREFERNGYHDSDFFMIVWNPVERKPETIEFATTRGWTYPCLATSVDASEETKREYANYLFAQDWFFWKSKIEQRVKALCDFRQFARDYGKHHGFPHWRLTALRKHYSMEDLGRLINLIGNTRLRSPFKLKLREQLINWLKDPAPKYPTPLSKKQMIHI